MNTLLKIILFLNILSCNNLSNSKAKFSNTGATLVLNGRNEVDSLKFSCDSCYEILQDKTVFDTIISVVTSDAKNTLRNKLSFKPISVDLTIIRQDSVYYTSGKPIDSLVAVIAKYKCIGKNAYGVENEVESTSLTYLINKKVANLEGKIKKSPLSLAKKGIVSRNLLLYTDDGTTMTIQPVILNDGIHLIVTTDQSCVEDSKLNITLANDEEISIKSWNKFNCNSTSYFRISPSSSEKLMTNPIKYISFSDDNLVFCSIPENEKDYFVQFVSLAKGK